MKKFTFTMQAVLDARRALREAREIELAEARAALAKAEELLASIGKEIQRALSSENIEKATEGSFFIQRERYLKKLRDLRKAQERKVSECSVKVEMALSRLKEAIIEMKKMERAQARQKSVWELDFKRDEQKASDEIATTRSHARILVGSFE